MTWPRRVIVQELKHARLLIDGNRRLPVRVGYLDLRVVVAEEHGEELVRRAAGPDLVVGPPVRYAGEQDHRGARRAGQAAAQLDVLAAERV